MNDLVTEGVPTSTAATRQSEPAVVAAIASGEGQPIAPEPAHGFGLQHGLMLLAAGVVVGALIGLWVQRIR